MESSEILTRLALSYCHTVLLPGLNWKKRKELGTMQCVKLNLCFFYKNIVYKCLFRYIT